MKQLLPIVCILFLLSQKSLAEHIIPTPKIYKETGNKTYALKKSSIKYEASDNQRIDYYRLITNKGTVSIKGNKQYALQTLRQLEDTNHRIPNVFIEDWSTYKFRGFMHDVGRNFQPVEMIKKDLEFLSRYKMNVFHFHLTDHPAWRIQCYCHPELNDPKYQRKGRDEGKFYTYDELREIISYAKSLQIVVIPEIDMPGHSDYFKNAFGFSMDSEKGRHILEEVFDEFFKEIPQEDCPYIHIGSDEIHIADPSGFMQWAENLVRSNGRRPIAWDPGLPTSGNTIRQIWNSASVKNIDSTNKSGQYLDSFVGYLNYYDPIGFASRIFLHPSCGEVTPSNDDKALGGILCLWNDVRVDKKSNINEHNGMEQGVMMFAEKMWNGKGYEGNSDLNPDPATTSEGYDLCEFEKKISYHRDHLCQDRNIHWVANAFIPWNLFIPAIQEKDTTLTTIKVWGGSINLDAVIKENNLNVPTICTCIAKTEIYTDNDTTIHAWIGFEAAARSNRLSGGIGEEGQFEHDGKLFVNNIPVKPSCKWNEPGKYRFTYNTWHREEEELPYTDEQFYWMRTPVAIKLLKGWNEIEVRAPRTFANQRWTFTFIPLYLCGENKIMEPSGLKYR